MVGHLWQGGKLADARKPLANDPEVKRCDGEPAEQRPANLVAVRHQRRQHESPAEREREMDWDRRRQQATTTVLAGEQDAARGQRCFERIAIREQGVSRRRYPAQDGGDAAGRQRLARVPTDRVTRAAPYPCNLRRDRAASYYALIYN